MATKTMNIGNASTNVDVNVVGSITATKFSGSIIPNSASKTVAASSWSASGSNFVADVSITGVTADSCVQVCLPNTITDTQLDAWLYAVITTGVSASGKITLTARGTKPTVDIPIVVTY